MSYELRNRDLLEEDDSRPGELSIYQVRDGAALADVLALAGMSDFTVDVYDGADYLVTFCGGSPYWYPHTGIGMHQIGSHGWCHDCHKDGLGYVHHLDYAAELAWLTYEASDDDVLRGQCEADGLTAEQYAQETAGRAVPLDGDYSFAVGCRELGVNADGLAAFAVDMWDMTTWYIAVELAPGAPDAAVKLAEERAYAASPKRCYDCKGHRGHSKRCHVTRDAEFEAQYPELFA